MPVTAFRYILLILLLASCSDRAFAQQTLRGVVWSMPDDAFQARRDFRAMKDAGVNAVRTPPINDERLLTLADTLGLQLFIDLPVSHLAAAHLRDTLNFARNQLSSVLSDAARHRSIRAVGLAEYSDTSDSTACAYFQDLADDARGRLEVYYVTRFVRNDACSRSVDFVLADMRDRDHPVAAIRTWEAQANRSPLGIGSLGIWVRGDTLRGLDVPSSPERQARYLEQQLSQLLSDTLSTGIPAVFVHRWRDVRADSSVSMYDLGPIERFGLIGQDGSSRAAMHVVSGFYSGSQTVFAFPQGKNPPESTPWTILLGWAVLVAIGIFYALSPRFRHMVPRYFQAHFFFRESVREGRDVLFGTSTLLLACLGAAAGIVAVVVLDAVRDTDAFLLAFTWLPDSIQGATTILLARPLVFLIFAASVYVMSLLIWTVILSLISRRRYFLAPAQVLMLVVWPRWALFLVMIGAMVASSMPGPNLYVIVGVIAAWLLVVIWSFVRTIIDLISVARVPAWLLIPAGITYPGVVIVIMVIVTAMTEAAEFGFIWHTISRS